jgi:hypothetical protein
MRGFYLGDVTYGGWGDDLNAGGMFVVSAG